MIKIKTARRKLTAKNDIWGRPPTAKLKKEKALQLKAEGRTVEQICKELEISRASYYRLI